MTGSKAAASTQSKNSPKVDGRHRRSNQSREAIAQAMFELVGEGNTRPSAQSVAQRAQVGIRSVFRHFDEMDRLYAEMQVRLREMLKPVFEAQAPAGSLEERGRQFVDLRCRTFEQIAPYKRAANLHEARSEYLRKERRTGVRDLRRWLQTWFPELADLPVRLARSVEAALSFEVWDHLRSQQGLSRRETREAIQEMVSALITRIASESGEIEE